MQLPNLDLVLQLLFSDDALFTLKKEKSIFNMCCTSEIITSSHSDGVPLRGLECSVLYPSHLWECPHCSEIYSCWIHSDIHSSHTASRTELIIIINQKTKVTLNSERQTESEQDPSWPHVCCGEAGSGRCLLYSHSWLTVTLWLVSSTFFFFSVADSIKHTHNNHSNWASHWSLWTFTLRKIIFLTNQTWMFNV